MDDDLFLQNIKKPVAIPFDERPPDFPTMFPRTAARTHSAPAVFPTSRVDELARQTAALRRRLQEVEAERAHLDTMLSLHPDPILVVNPQREIVRGNAAALTLFGDDILQRDLTFALPDQNVFGATNRVLMGGGAEVVDFKLARPADRYFRTHITLVPDHAEQGPAALLTITDLTEVKRAAQIRADFVANASHELRTPLSILLGFIETLTGSAADDAEARKRFLPIMQEQAVRMARLVDDLLSLSCIELTEHAPPTERVELPGMLKTIVQAFELRASARGMWFDLAIASDLPAVVGDPVELAQVFQNMIDNAIKYAHPNTGITIETKTSNRLAHGVAITVRDRGAGIEERHLARLTERFYRVDAARSCSLGGTGLGLAIVKHVLNRHRGILEIDSKLGEGSTFTVHLSCAVASQQAEAGTAALPEQGPDGDRQGSRKRGSQPSIRRPGAPGWSSAPAVDLFFNRDRVAS